MHTRIRAAVGRDFTDAIETTDIFLVLDSGECTGLMLLRTPSRLVLSAAGSGLRNPGLPLMVSHWQHSAVTLSHSSATLHAAVFARVHGGDGCER